MFSGTVEVGAHPSTAKRRDDHAICTGKARSMPAMVCPSRARRCDWLAQAARLLTPLAEAVGRYVLQAAKIHGDDTPVRVLGGKGAAAKTGACGSTCATIGLLAMHQRPPCGCNTRPTARASIRSGTCATGAASCRPTPSPATTLCTRMAASSRRPAGATRAASSGTSTSGSTDCPEHWRTRRSSASGGCLRSRPTSGGAHPMNDMPSGKSARASNSMRSKPGQSGAFGSLQPSPRQIHPREIRLRSQRCALVREGADGI